MNAHAVAAELGINERTVRRAIKDGALSATRRGREWDVDLDVARELFASGRRPAANPYQEALAEALELLRAFDHQADAEEIERRHSLVYIEPKAKVLAS